MAALIPLLAALWMLAGTALYLRVTAPPAAPAREIALGGTYCALVVAGMAFAFVALAGGAA